ncbi:MAG: glycosyl transferase family 51 [Proteobacteria bacterium]|nr:glycosyl transferase family 51 [Pseudomonadota bacterium]
MPPMTSIHSLLSALKALQARIRPRLAAGFAFAWKHLRHPSRRGVIRLFVAVPVVLLLYVLILIPFTPSISDIRKATLDQPAQILFADGTKLTEFKQSNREWVKLSQVSPRVIEALIATEDHRFYEHHGLDWRRIASSMVHTLRGDRQGGSTLTQQLARNLYPEEIGRSPTLTRKIKEAITALKIEAVHSKDEILETYLNTVPFLYNAFGIEMAARTYFDTSAQSLDVLESATLVGMLKGNSTYNPVLNPERAMQRRNTVLAQMVKRQKLDKAKFESLKKKPLRIDFERQTEPPGPAPHFAQQLRKWLIAWADRNDYNIYSDGLVVYTTLDSRLQTQAQQAVARQGNQLQGIANAVWGTYAGWRADTALVQAFLHESPEYRAAISTGVTPEQAMKQLLADAAFMKTLHLQKTQIQAGFLALDPRNGHIKAWVGSRDFGQDAFDHVQQARRQPGSTFKPFVYGEAFRQGASPDDTLIDQAVEIAVGNNEIWRPADARPPSGRAITLRNALAYSKNTITAQLMQNLGPAKVARLARAMGVRQSPLEEVPSLALGTSPVTLKEMVAAYGTIANGGNYIEPVLVTRIEDRQGRLIEQIASAAPEPVFPREVNYTLLDVMRGVVDRGTGSDIRNRYGIHADVAGKTGTTQDNTDGWFILMHPQLVAGAWVGFNDNRITLRSDYWGQGAHSALPIVGDFFRAALRSRSIDARTRFEAPDEKGLLTRMLKSSPDWIQGMFEEKSASAPASQPVSVPPQRLERPAETVSSAPIASQPQSGPDPLQEKIDQIVEEGKKEERAASAIAN